MLIAPAALKTEAFLSVDSTTGGRGASDRHPSPNLARSFRAWVDLHERARSPNPTAPIRCGFRERSGQGWPAGVADAACSRPLLRFDADRLGRFREGDPSSARSRLSEGDARSVWASL